MKTVICLLRHAMEIWGAQLMTKIDRCAPLRAELERLNHELDAETQRASYWNGRVSKLLQESATLDNEVNWLRIQNDYLRSVVLYDRCAEAGRMIATVDPIFKLDESEAMP